VSDDQVRRGREFARQQAGKPYVWGRSSMTPEQAEAWLEWAGDEERVRAWCEEHGVTVEPMPSTEEILADMTRQAGGKPWHTIPWDPPPRWRPGEERP